MTNDVMIYDLYRVNESVPFPCDTDDTVEIKEIDVIDNWYLLLFFGYYKILYCNRDMMMMMIDAVRR